MKVIITNIQRFSLHDGPGIRTTIFFKGCNLKCPWCSNPENINFNIEDFNKNNISGKYGKEYTLEELENEILKDKDFYSNHGGVTFSGGECLWQFEKIEPLLKRLKNNGINMCVETALNVPIRFVDIALKYIDEFYIDIKIVDKNKQNIIGTNVDAYLLNLDKILKYNDNVIIRFPVIPQYTYTENNLIAIIDILKKYKIKKMEIFKIHKLGESKYESLNIKMHYFDEISDLELENLKNKFARYVRQVNIIKI